MINSISNVVDAYWNEYLAGEPIFVTSDTEVVTSNTIDHDLFALNIEICNKWKIATRLQNPRLQSGQFGTIYQGLPYRYGPGIVYYLDKDKFTPHEPAPGMEIVQLEDLTHVAEIVFDDTTDNIIAAFAVQGNGNSLSFSAVRRWGEYIASVSVATPSPHSRQRGLATVGASAAIHWIFENGLQPQWDTQMMNFASRAIAERKLGFERYGTFIYGDRYERST